eukprot:TRINITY_DN3045_c0_g1_i2.p1 TRINITY_DN3045_c0_g1~~TRINITY_DN3045_c0_g1_i2.p1  ORF type:complete len:267 (-),score=48.54 TRINITY_DN3045_c0_g1_i2:12-812(-)
MEDDDGSWREMAVGEEHGHGHNKRPKFLNLKRYQVVVIGIMSVILLLFVIVLIDSFQDEDVKEKPPHNNNSTSPSSSMPPTRTSTSTPTPTPVTEPSKTKTAKPTKPPKVTPSEKNPVDDEVDPPIVVMVSFDGFRHSYFDAEDMSSTHPTFDEIIRNGVSMPIRPVFPSLTFPNHYSLATGLYAESHGIVSNNFYDPNLKDTFNYVLPRSVDSKWWLGEPIWVTTVKQNKRSAVYFWPGSESNISGHRPTAVSYTHLTLPTILRV